MNTNITSPLPPRACVVSQFPEFCETFILNEIMELNKRGIPFEIFSLKLCEDRRFQPGAQDLMFSCTHYAPTPWSPKLLFASIGRLFRTPGRYLSTLALALHARKGPFSVFLKTLFVFYQAAWFAKKAEELGLRHVHAHWASIPSSAGLFIARLAGASFSLTAHAYDIYIDRTLLEEKIEAAQYLITCTQYNKRYMLDLYPHVDEHKIQVFYHGVDLNAFDEGGERAETKQEEVPILLSIGRLCDTKGFPDLLTACAVLKSRGLRFRCRIVGDGYMRRDLALEISLMELGDCVEIVGLIPREQVIQEMRQARLFVLPCVVTPRGDRDGLPNVVVEAMSMGLPVITTNISALPEGVEDGVNGRLVPEKNPGALADAIAGCWEDAETLRKWGENSRRKAHEVFGLQENAEALAQFIKGQSV
ncbi:TPA: hypothetical protein DDW35_10050 [Candidatus Sumerlaeota bacterium]|jgi:glycosyltransferase involved in cell wall biosynthesis|nr:hypothetical protein [Candidatus Sumerlaeota bacterium]